MRKLLLGLIGLLFAVPGWATNLPAGYTELEYIESTGTQYIDTGIKANNTVEVETKFRIPIADAATHIIFSGRNAISSSAVDLRRFNSGGVVYSNTFNNVSKTVLNKNDTNIHSYTFHNNEAKLDDLSIGLFQSTTFNSDYTIWLFACNQPEPQFRDVVDIYFAKFWDNGILVRNFIPAKRNSDNEIGMYDTVNNEFYANQGTGDFVAGPVIPEQQIRIATTAYNSARFSPVVTELNDTIATIRDVVTNTINQTAAIADLQTTKQTRPDENCPAGKKCLLVEDNDGTPHWYEIIENAYGLPSGYTQVDYVTNTAQTMINTGLQFDFSKNYEIELKASGVAGSWYILQARESSSLPISGVSGSMTGNQIGFGFNGTYITASQISRVVGHIYNLKGTINNGNLTLYVKDETAGTEETVTGTYTVTTGQSVDIGLFGNLAGNRININSDVYFARIKEDGNYIMDYVPCRQGTTTGFYDKVSNTFKTATGLSAGPVAQ